MEVQETYILQAESELRSEVAQGGFLKVVLIEGSAEVFGIEMAPNREYIFTDENVAMFSWYGCKLKTFSENARSYVSDSTPMVAIVNTHMQLEARRDVAVKNQDFGPRILIAGPNDSGKSTLARILSAYACRLERTPVYIDLDVGQSAMSIPGTICATPLDKFSLSVEEGFSHATPLIYSLGHTSPKDHAELYNKLVSILAGKVKDRLERDAELRSSGIIVNTCGYIEDEGYDILLKCIQSFAIDIVLVMGHDRLYSSLCSSLKDSLVIVKLPLSGGVVKKERQFRSRSRQLRIKEYFYGKLSSSSGLSVSYSPARMDIPISSVKFLRAGGLQLSENMRVMGDVGSEATQLVRVSPSDQDLNRCILAILHPVSDGIPKAGADELPQSLLYSNVAGFLYVVALNLEQDTITVLSPCNSSLPSPYLLVGSVKWDDNKS